MPWSATTRFWSRAVPARRTTSASRRPRSPSSNSPSRARRPRPGTVRVHGQGCPPGERRQGLPGGQPEPALPDHHQGAHRTRLRPAGDHRRRLAALAALVLGQSRGVGGLMKISIIGTGLRRPGHRRVPGREGPSGHLRRHRSGARRRAQSRGVADLRGGPR